MKASAKLDLTNVRCQTVIISPVNDMYRCIETVRSSPYAELASELEMSKAITFLKKRDIPKVRIIFK